MEKKFDRFWDFYPFYLTEHLHPVSRTLHFIGTGLVIASFLYFLFTLLIGSPKWVFLIIIPFLGYGFAWVGHFFFEKNKPATFQYPSYSLGSDFVMFWHLLTGKERFNPRKS
ncbi:MAG: DUF962 domain-containing protein [Bacteroidota bacterium]|nr:DUF962 domain-containing protein [Bacteroidota bacterium]